MRLTLLPALFLALSTSATSQQQRRAIEVWPVDEAVNSPDLVATRTSVIDALRRHDLDRLMMLMADDVYQYGNGSQSATAEKKRANVRDWFAVEWKFNFHRADGLTTALSMGGSFTTMRGSRDGERQFCAPYTYSAFPTDPPDVDGEPTRYSLLIAKDVSVRSRPGVQGPIVARVSYSLVRVVTLEGDRDANGNISWEHVITNDGIDGYVPASVVRAPDGYYMCFGQRAGGWRITEFGEGRYPGDP